MEQEVRPPAPYMRNEEIDCLRRHVAQASIYLEFGMGGSTALACESPAKRIFAVESDREWIAKACEHPLVTKALAEGRMTIRHVDYGPAGRWGFPTWESVPAKFPDYYLSVWRDIGDELPDFVLVDGRFRVACAVQALLRCGPEVKIAIHDWSSKRPYYEGIREFVRPVDRAWALVIFAPAKRLDYKRLATFAFDYLFDFR